MHTHYDNLKVARNAPHAVIKAAYRALSQQYHPDKNKHPDATRIMRILNDAWAVLGDADARADYDRQLDAEGTEAPGSATESPQQTDPPPQSTRTAQQSGDTPPPPAAGPKADSGKATLMNWYGSINRGQRIFMFVVASIAALFGFGGEGMALILVLPLLLLIYLQLGAPKKTTANEERSHSDARSSTDTNRKASRDSEPEAPAADPGRKPDSKRPRSAPHSLRALEATDWLVLGGTLLFAALVLIFSIERANSGDVSQSAAPLVVPPSASSVSAPPVIAQPVITSFDCSKAHWPSEVLICGDDDLAAMDRNLASTFAQAKAVTTNKKSFGEIARRNWNWRNKNCTDKACLIAWYGDEQRWLLGVLSNATAPDATTSTLSAVNAAPDVATATSVAGNLSPAMAPAVPQEVLQPTSEGNDVTCVTYRGEISCK
ncbi:DnaJ domain-containing protein [Paraburkholderia strydomiana]